MSVEGAVTDAGPIALLLAADHRRLEDLLERAATQSGDIDAALFEQFRAGLLRHIAMEEKILLPAARRARGGEPLEIAGQLRLDHGAIAALLVPTPTPEVVRRLRALLTLHDALEEGPHAAYDDCDRLLTTEVNALLDQLRAHPDVRTAPHTDGPFVEQHIVERLTMAGRERVLRE